MIFESDNKFMNSKVKRLFRSILITISVMISLTACDEVWDDESADAETVIEEEHSEANEEHDIEADPASVDDGARSATVLVYMNGSDLETKAGAATADISEMI